MTDRPRPHSYKLGFYINNLTDAVYYNIRNTQQPFGTFEQVARPRTFGLRVSVEL